MGLCVKRHETSHAGHRCLPLVTGDTLEAPMDLPVIPSAATRWRHTQPRDRSVGPEGLADFTTTPDCPFAPSGVKSGEYEFDFPSQR